MLVSCYSGRLIPFADAVAIGRTRLPITTHDCHWFLLEDQLTCDFMKSFLGYGRLDGQCWFIGMEEGGGSSIENVSRRFAMWNDRGRRELEDLREFHCLIEMAHLFGEKPCLQRTWAHLMRILLASKGIRANYTKLCEFQAAEWGRTSGDHCLLELLPLPSPSTKHWHYSQWSHLDFLRSLKEYVQYALPFRVERLRAKIEFHKPSAVIFYGMKHRPYWQSLADITFEDANDEGILGAKADPTTYILVKHPAA